MKLVCIGDVHGRTKEYQEMLLSKFSGQRTLQVGDMGLGFVGVPSLQKDIMGETHKFIRGNHDDPAKCRASAGYLGDWGYLDADSLFWVAGAFSIDYIWRNPGISWWEDEELAYTELQKAVDLYEKVKPRFVVSHEAPTVAATYMLVNLLGGWRTEKLRCGDSRTSTALQNMFELHQPEEWVFGHYHFDKSFHFRGTKFTCVAELSTYEIETGMTSGLEKAT